MKERDQLVELSRLILIWIFRKWEMGYGLD